MNELYVQILKRKQVYVIENKIKKDFLFFTSILNKL